MALPSNSSSNDRVQQETQQQFIIRESKEMYEMEGLIPTHARYKAWQDEFAKINRECYDWKNRVMKREEKKLNLPKPTTDEELLEQHVFLNRPSNHWTKRERENDKYINYYLSKQRLEYLEAEKEYIQERRDHFKISWDIVRENQRDAEIEKEREKKRRVRERESWRRELQK